jgi:hypothetical protein
VIFGVLTVFLDFDRKFCGGISDLAAPVQALLIPVNEVMLMYTQ